MRGPSWCFTEYGRTQVAITPDAITIGQSTLRAEATTLTIDLNDRAAPLPRRIAGQVRIEVPAWHAAGAWLDPGHRHAWIPLAPCARIAVEMERPAWRWQGSGYVDTNTGTRALESDFTRWDWSRAPLPDGSALLYYDAELRTGARTALARRVWPDGTMQPVEMPPRVALPRGLWGMHGSAHGEQATLVRRLEDSPFYTRSLIRTPTGDAVHESLSLERFTQPWVQVLLPFRMRKGKARGSAPGPRQGQGTLDPILK